MFLKPSRSMFAAALVLAACSVHAAESCEDLRSRIESNIAGNGVLNFSVTVVDENAVVAGQVVGHCGKGTQKIVYSRGEGVAPAASASPSAATKPAVAPKPGKSNILTECKDGTVSVGGSCKR